LSSGHKTKPDETWKALFSQHKDRIEGKSPIDNKTPEEMQKEFLEQVGKCSDKPTYEILADMIDNVKAVQTNQCTDAFIALQNDLTEKGIL